MWKDQGKKNQYVLSFGWFKLTSHFRNKFLGEFERIKEPRELGLWDLIFNPDIVPTLEGYQRWDPLQEEKKKEIKKLKIDPNKLEEDVVSSLSKTIELFSDLKSLTYRSSMRVMIQLANLK